MSLPSVTLKNTALPGYAQPLDLTLAITRLDFQPKGQVLVTWSISPAGTNTVSLANGTIELPGTPLFVDKAHQEFLEASYKDLLKSYLSKSVTTGTAQ